MCKPTKKNISKEDNTNSLFTSKLQTLHLETTEGEIDLSSRISESVKRSSGENNQLNKLQEEYEQLSKSLKKMEAELESKKEQSKKLEKEVNILKHMFIANQLDIDEFSKALSKVPAE
jgi:septal ring factor EnvC (AmiA/AmiB activator)